MNNTVTPNVQQNAAAKGTIYAQDKRKPTAIRLSVGFFDCDKIRILNGQKNGSSIVYLYLNLLDIAAKSNRSGALFVADGIPYDAEMIANLTRCDSTVVKGALETLERYGMICQKDDVYSIVGYSRLVEFTVPRSRRAK